MAKGKEPSSENVSGEVSNGFWSCRDISDIVPLHTQRNLFLKPVAKINASISLPQLKTPGKTISTWDVMEKIRYLIRPDEFGSLKVVKSTLEFIRLEGDVRDRSRLSRVLSRLDLQCLKLEGFSSTLKIRAAESKDDFPTRHSWDSYFRDAKHMNELKAGERPDTIHVLGLPVKWFCEEGGNTPSESFVKMVFARWGTVRRVDVPAADSYRSRMRLGQNMQKFSYEDGLFFDAYVQYIEYMDFVRAMDALRGMKLLKKEGLNNYLTAAIKVDFDKTKHMSDNSVSHRAFERKRIIAQDNLAAEKMRKREEAENKKKEEQRKKEEAEAQTRDSRRKGREEKRKRKALTVFRKQEEDKVSMKIAREERKLIKAQRQLESIRLLDELFDRIKTKIEKKEINPEPLESKDVKAENDGNKESNTAKEDEKKKKKSKKKKVKKKRKKNKKGSSDNSSEDSEEESGKKKLKSVTVKSNPQNSVGPEGALDGAIPYPAMYPRFPPQPWYYETALPLLYPGSTRGRRGRGRGRGRGNWHENNRTMNPMPSQMFYNKQYYKYFANLAGQDYNIFEEEYERSRSRSRRLSKSRSRSRSRSRRYRRRSYKSRSRSRSRSSRSKSRSRSRSRGRRSRSRSRNNRSHSRVKITRAKSCSITPKRKSRSKSPKRKSHSKTPKKKSRSKSPKKRSKSPKKRSKSPKQHRSRSSSWSLPKTPSRRSCSWSKSVDEKT